MLNADVLDTDMVNTAAIVIAATCLLLAAWYYMFVIRDKDDD